MHWLLALLIIFQLGLAFYMGDLPEDGPAQNSVEEFHVSLGVTILCLTVVRIAIRLCSKSPALPSSIVGWQRTLANAAHLLLYFLMISIPMTGWAIRSFRREAFDVWGGLKFPPLPGVGNLPFGGPRENYEVLELLHGEYLSWAFIMLIGLHILAALKHQFDGNRILYRMLPGSAGSSAMGGVDDESST